MEARTQDSPFNPRNILVAVDFLESSRLVLDYAVGFGKKYDSKITLLHCLEYGQAALEMEAEGQISLTRKSAEESLAALTAQASKAGVTLDWKVAQGNPYDTLPEWAKALEADLLVMGTHGVHRGMDHLFLGSNTEKILLAARCPTLTVGPHVKRGVDLEMRFDQVIYISDGSPESIVAARYALGIGTDFNSHVDDFQILARPFEEGSGAKRSTQDEQRELMDDPLGQGQHVSFAPDSDRDGVRAQILKRAQESESGLIVLGVKTSSWLGRHLNTSFAYELLSSATCPVLTIHTTDQV